MHKKDKRKFTAAFKVKVAMEALKGQSTIAEIAKNYDLHRGGEPSQSDYGLEKDAIRTVGGIIHHQREKDSPCFARQFLSV